MRTFKQRVFVTLAATLLAGACGTLVGYLIGCAVAVRMAESSLKTYATQTIKVADASSAESRRLLKTMNTSQFPACSDAEVAWFRSLIYQSENLKDAGRMRDGKIECSATLGRLNQPIQVPASNFSQQDGTKCLLGIGPIQSGRSERSESATERLIRGIHPLLNFAS